MPDLLGVLPDRPLRARPPTEWVERLMAPLGLATLIAMIGACLLFIAPPLYMDWRVRDVAVPILEGRVTAVSCKLIICTVTMTAPAGQNGRILSRTVSTIFIALEDVDDRATRVVGDPQRPDWLTTDVALDHFYDRLASLLVVGALLVILARVAVREEVAAYRVRSSWRRAVLMPIALELVSTQPNGLLGRLWTVRAENGRVAQWGVPLRAKPFVLGASRILGLGTHGMADIMPLDAELRWVELSHEERLAAWRVPIG